MKTGILLLGLVWAASSVGLTKAMFWPDAALTVQASSVQPSPGSADKTKPKFGADAVPIQQARDYLRSHEAPDFWALMPYYTPQATGSSCSAASIAMLVNALRGIPALAKDSLITEASLLETVGNREWARNTALGGDGVSWAELETYLRQSLDAFGLERAEVEIVRPQDATPATLERLRRLLVANEQSADDIILAVFNQGTLTGDADVGHVSPIGAYDAERGRVLILDVDRRWYVPYWSSDERLLAAMLHASPDDPETGGLIHIRLRRGGTVASAGHPAAPRTAD